MVKVASKDMEEYVHIFRDEYVKSIGKGHRRSNRVDHHTTLQERVEDALTLRFQADESCYVLSETFGTYCVKNMHDRALQQATQMVLIIREVIKSREYVGFTEARAPKGDDALMEAYKTLSFDFSVRMTPTGFRAHYWSQRKKHEGDAEDYEAETEEVGKLTDAYLAVLRLITGGDPDGKITEEEPELIPVSLE